MGLNDTINSIRSGGGAFLRRSIVGDEVLQPTELANEADPGLFGPSSVAWRIHGDASMLIGGLRSLFFQTVHPPTMAGVADHSDYRNDPWGRLHRTSRFVGATTFGSTAAATQSIDIVRHIHERVSGTTPDGVAYTANDPHLLLWVHITEVDSFLTAFNQFGSGRLRDAEQDRYIAEMAVVATMLGADTPPTNRAELADAIEAFRPECAAEPRAHDAVRFLLTPPMPLAARASYGVLSAGAIASLPGWVRHELRLPLLPLSDTLAIRPAALATTKAIGWMMSAHT